MSDCSAGWSVGPDLARLPDWRIVPGEPGVMVVTFAEGELPPGEWTVTAGYNDLDLITGTAVADGDALTITFDAEASADLFDDGVLTVPWRLYLDGAWWGGGNIRPASLHDDPGPCGATIVLSPPGSDPITVVVSRCAEDGEPGPPGADGREVELRVQGTMLQWRYTSPPGLPWVDLADLGDGGGAGAIAAIGTLSYDDVTATPGDPGDPVTLLNFDGSIELVPLPRPYIPVGSKVLVLDLDPDPGPSPDPDKVGLWTWDGTSFSRDSQPAPGTPVFLNIAGVGGPAWMATVVVDPSSPWAPVGVRTDRAQTWTAVQTTRRPVVGGQLTPFVRVEVVDPNDSNAGIEMGQLIAAAVDIPGLGPLIVAGVELQEWNPFTGGLTGYRTYVVSSFIGVDEAFNPAYRVAFRRASPTESVFDSALTQVMVGDPIGPQDAATKGWVNSTVADAIADIDIPDPDPVVRMNFRGAWDNAAAYAAQDVVLHSSAAWVSTEDDLAGVEPGSDGTEETWVKVSDTTSAIIPSEGTEGWTWAGAGLTAEAIDALPGYEGFGGGDISYTGAFSSAAIGHSLDVPSSRSGAGALGFRFANPGPGHSYDTFLEVVVGDYDASLNIFAVSDDGGAHAYSRVCACPARTTGDGKVSLWRIVVVGSDGDPTVLAFRMQLYDV